MFQVLNLVAELILLSLEVIYIIMVFEVALKVNARIMLQPTLS